MPRGAGVLSVLVGLAVSVRGQELGVAAGKAVLVAPADSPSTPEYGATSLTSVVVGASDILPPASDISYFTHTDQPDGGVFRYQTGPPSVNWWSAVHLPNGAIIESVQMHACDTSASGAINFGLGRSDAQGGGSALVTPLGSTGYDETPGCAFFSVTPSTPPLVVDNANSAYLVGLSFNLDYTGGIRLGSFRVFYRLQVSPAPAVATFTDVPTNHAFFRFVEALASAGITGGCGGGQYCPDSPVTRGQMAVFLSKALGLHFPN